MLAGTVGGHGGRVFIHSSNPVRKQSNRDSSNIVNCDVMQCFGRPTKLLALWP